jgi:hypothetical protein
MSSVANRPHRLSLGQSGAHGVAARTVPFLRSVTRANTWAACPLRIPLPVFLSRSYLPRDEVDEEGVALEVVRGGALGVDARKVVRGGALGVGALDNGGGFRDGARSFGNRGGGSKGGALDNSGPGFAGPYSGHGNPMHGHHWAPHLTQTVKKAVPQSYGQGPWRKDHMCRWCGGPSTGGLALFA